MGNAISGLLTHFAASSCNTGTFLGLLPWNHYLNLQPDSTSSHVCYLPYTSFSFNVLLLILLVLVDDMLRIVGFLAVIYVIYGGIKYIMSQGAPDKTAEAQTTVTNALIGLAIAVTAIWFVSFLGGRFGAGAGGTSNTFGLNLSTLPNPAGTANNNVIQIILNIVFGIVGALSFLFVVIGGFRYITSQGDPQSVAKAKGTIIYALVGLVVAILAESIVSLVASKL